MATNIVVNPCRCADAREYRRRCRQLRQYQRLQTKRMDRFVLSLLKKSIVLFLGACMLALLVGAA